MQIKCEYCGSYISENDEVCSQCGAVNANFKRSTDGTPKTIEELKVWYKSKNLPPSETTRFFIGENYTGARAFGIYEENGEYIVYKNKDDGSRAVRYRGKDQAYAVNELFLKLKSEILNQKAHNINNRKNGDSNKNETVFDKTHEIMGYILMVGFALFFLSGISTFVLGAFHAAKDWKYVGNYYLYNDDIYYCDSYVDNSFYMYDYDDEDYLPVEIPQEMYDDIENYRFSEGDEWYDDFVKFEDSETGQYLNSIREESNSSDNDYSWDSSDSWDSDSTDWGSDW